MMDMTRGEEAQAAVADLAKKAKRKRVRVKSAFNPLSALMAAHRSIAEHRNGVEGLIAFHQGKIDEARALLSEIDGVPGPARPITVKEFAENTPAMNKIVKLPVDFTSEQAKKAGLLPINVAQLCRRGVITKVADGKYRKVGR